MASKVEIHLTKHDRQISAMQKLILTGMRMLSKHDENFRRMEEEGIALRREMRLLSTQQLRTEKTLDRFIRSMERGRNGHS
jgi:hypothetical protein